MEKNNEIRSVAIIGNGMLGTQIAMTANYHGYHVFLYDPVPGMFHNTMEKYRDDFTNKGIIPSIPFDHWEKIKSSCQIFDSIEKAAADADLVIEAVPEILETKIEIFKTIGKKSPQHAILATNSSSLPVSRLEKYSGHPERCVNIHFYQVLSGMNMVDVMGGTKTSALVKEKAISWVKTLKCVPLSVNRELLGFCFNRVWRAVKKETLHMWANGFVHFTDIDRAWMIFTGMKMGPFGLMDLVGIDTTYNIEMVYYDDSKDPKDHPPKALLNKIEKGELGVKTGKGFYKYPNPDFADADFLKS